MKLFLTRYSLILALVALAGCSKKPAPPSPSEQVLAVVRAQVDALNRKDLPAVMAALDPQSAGFEQTRQMSAKIFQAYDLRYTLKEAAVESINGDEAKVRFVQTTEKISGPAFRNNRIEGVHTLKKRNGQWKIAGTEATKIEYLDK